MKTIRVYSFWVRQWDADDSTAYHSESVIADSIPEAKQRLKDMGYRISDDPYFLGCINKKNYIRETYVAVK